MRIVKYPSRGKPTQRLADKLNELAMLAEAAASLTNVERWSQQRSVDAALGRQGGGSLKSIVPANVRERGKKLQYETSVVDEFVQLGAQSFAFHGSEAVWERPMLLGKRGRPHAIDVSLFNAAKKEESRIEFGYWSESKLRDDAQKLLDLSGHRVPETEVTNYVILWRHEQQVSHTDINSTRWMRRAREAAAMTQLVGGSVELRLATSQDAFSPRSGPSWFQVALFEVLTSATSSDTNGGQALTAR